MFVWLNPDVDVQVALGTVGNGFAVFAQADGGTVVDAGWDFQVDGLLFGLRAPTVTDAADFFRHFTATFTGRANGSLLNITENCSGGGQNLARAAALVTGF